MSFILFYMNEMGDIKVSTKKLQILGQLSASNAGTLDGKDSQYFTPYKNLVVNSDFEHWVAQIGLNAEHGTLTYAGDRWATDSGSVTGDKNASGDGYSNIALNGTIRQVIPDAPSVATPFINMVSGEAEINYDNGTLTITSNGGVIKNVLLLAGEWSTCPLYIGKGYATELHDCMRVFCTFKSAGLSCNITSNTVCIVDIPLQVSMRATPSVVFVTNVTYVRANGTNYTLSGAAPTVAVGSNYKTGCLSLTLTFSSIKVGNSSATFAKNDIGYVNYIEGYLCADYE